jgi:predicted acylesterase/phospholipase RssA
MYLDGGLVDHIPLQPAIDAGADAIYVLSVGFPCPPPANHRSARAVLSHSIGILLSQRVRYDGSHLREHNPDLRIVQIPPVCAQIALRDFSRADELIRRAREQTEAFLAGLPTLPAHIHAISDERVLVERSDGRRPSPSPA